MVDMMLSYEQIRPRLIEESKKRMLKRKLKKDAQKDLHVSSSPRKPSWARPRKKRTPVASLDVMRPIRAKNLPPSYKEPVESSHVMRPIHANEEVWHETLEKLKRTCKRKCLQKRVYASEEPRENATEREVKLQSSLEPELPILAKKPALEKPKRTYQRKALQKRVYASKEVGLESPEKPKRMCQRKELPDRVYASAEARKNATERAVKLESSLEPEFPSFVKSMTHSHVTQGFWLGLRRKFCLAHMPDKDKTIILVDENNKESETTYLAHSNGLSAGWRGFAIDHRLVDGDAVVFHRVEETKFKVYIIRANGEATNDSNVAEINKKEEEKQWVGKRKRGGEVSRV